MVSPAKLKIVEFMLKESLAKIECMKDYAQPTTRKNLEHVLIYVRTTYLPTRRQQML